MSEHVFATSVAMHRNYEDLPFLLKLPKDAAACVSRAVEASGKLDSRYYLYPVKDLDDCFLREIEDKWLVPPSMKEKHWANLLIRHDNQVSIAVGESDHLTLRSPLVSDPMTAVQELDGIARTFSQEHRYTTDHQFGHLTVSLRHAGTGVQVSSILHLPVLGMLKQVTTIAGELKKQGRFELLPLKMPRDQEAGALYILTNQFAQESTRDMLAAMEESIASIHAREIALRDRIFKENRSRNYEDQVMRSFGILCYARKLPHREFLTHWSNIRLGAAVGLLSTDPKLIDQLFWDARRTLILLHAHGQADERAINYLRADMVRARLTGGL